MKLRCSNPECEGADSPVFSVNVVVYDDRSIQENLNKVPADQFVCCHCDSVAELDS